MLFPSRLKFSLFKTSRLFNYSASQWLYSNDKVELNKMVQVLNVAEKNDAAKNISELLSRGI